MQWGIWFANWLNGRYMAGKAVVRNRTRRRIKEAYRIHEGAFFPGYDIVVVARVRAAHSRYRELERSLLSLADRLKRRGIWCWWRPTSPA